MEKVHDKVDRTEVGSIEILNVGKGDVKVSFDSDKPAEVAKARKIITDMLGNGYLIVIEHPEHGHVRVEEFDAETDEYIVYLTPETNGATKAKTETTPRKKRGPRRTNLKQERVKASGTKATAVAPTAGG